MFHRKYLYFKCSQHDDLNILAFIFREITQFRQYVSRIIQTYVLWLFMSFPQTANKRWPRTLTLQLSQPLQTTKYFQSAAVTRASSSRGRYVYRWNTDTLESLNPSSPYVFCIFGRLGKTYESLSCSSLVFSFFSSYLVIFSIFFFNHYGTWSHAWLEV